MLFEKLRVLLLILINFKLIKAQTTRLGECLNVSVVDNFDGKAFEGHWFRQYRTFRLDELFNKCIVFDYEKHDNGTYTVKRTMVNEITQAKHSYTDTCKTISPGVGELASGFRYKFVDTDYTSYALIYGCKQILPGLLHKDFASILTREQLPSDNTTMEAFFVAKENSLPVNEFIQIDQENCAE